VLVLFDHQAERYRKELAAYLRQKKRQEEQQQQQGAAPRRGGKGAAAGIKSKAKKLVPPKKPKAAVVRACSVELERRECHVSEWCVEKVVYECAW